VLLLAAIPVVALVALILAVTVFTPEPTTGDCIVALDLTVGHDDPAIADTYARWAEGVLQRCADDGAVNFVVFPITNSTDADLPRLEPIGKPFDIDASQNIDNQRARIRKWIADEAPGEIERLFDEGSSIEGGTDILSAPSVAEDYFNDADEVDFRQFWLVTDGIHIERPGLDMRSAPLERAERQVELAGLEAEGLLPRLDDVEVHMCGIGGGDHSENVSDRQQTDIESLWEDFFDAAGADLDDYDVSCPTPQEG
jgi:hypothetical protein